MPRNHSGGRRGCKLLTDMRFGGGARGDAQDSEETIVTSSRPSVSAMSTNPPLDGGTFTGWRITVVNPTGGTATGIRPEVWVVCANP